MIQHFVLTGDTHGRVVARLENIRRNLPTYEPDKTAVIILGDAGINFWLNKSDIKNKRIISSYGYTIYCVRGNHEERPENLTTTEILYDESVKGNVWYEPDFPLIKYFMDGGEYEINGHKVLVIGGAYSVDKWWRLQRAQGSFSGWFKDEQLTEEEMVKIATRVMDKTYDFVFTHTAPISFEPRDLFLDCVDQSTVDKSMELWLNDISSMMNWKVWCFGHYHADRIEAPGVEQFYYHYEDMETVWNRWCGECTYEKEKDKLSKSPYMEFLIDQGAELI